MSFLWREIELRRLLHPSSQWTEIVPTNRYQQVTEGLTKLGKASPGGAGRNRTLGLKALENIRVPIPPIDKQQWFDALQTKMRKIRAIRELAARDTNALIPAMLHEVFNGAGTG
jgi:type I restriction enzyme S subunit